MSENVNDNEFSGNVIRPFQLESSSLRGRILRLNTVLDDILKPHGYPMEISQLLGEVVTLSALFSSMLKFDGIFTLQIYGDGAVSMLVADVTSDGDIRGCATFSEEKFNALKDKKTTGLHDLLGKGYLAFTVDQGEDTERYQGIVELKGDNLIDSVQHYFMQSEQLNTAIMIAVEKNDNAKNGEGAWHSAGLMLQHMPSDGGHETVPVVDVTQYSNVSNLNEDDWRRAMILMESCKREELLSDDLSSHDVLLRLFHEEGVRVFEPAPLQHQCRCSQERVENVFKMLSDEERQDMVVDGKIIMTCEFCSKDYNVKPLS